MSASAYYTRRSGARNPGQPAPGQPAQPQKTLYNNFVKSGPVMQQNPGAPIMNTSSASGSIPATPNSIQNPLPTGPGLNSPAGDVKPPVTAPQPTEVAEKDIEPIDASECKTEGDAEETEANQNEQGRRWAGHKRKFGPYKVDKKLKKRRLNARLEKVLKPKNAFLIFNELNLKPDYEIKENVSRGPGKTYTAFLQLDGHTYSGDSTTIAGAKMVAADVALKDWFLKSFRKAESAPVEKMETEENGLPVIKPEPAPWSAVGSYAMHLLFARWQMDPSAVINVPSGNVSDDGASQHTASPSAPPKKTGKAPAIVSELIDYMPQVEPKFPPNPENCHPLYVFNLAFPNMPIVEKQDENNVDARFQVQCKFNGVLYEAKARSKKEARRQLALQILRTYQIEFPNPTAST